MPSMKQLQYLKKIVETGSYHQAAEQLFIAQSALSRQILLLEDELGFQIFNRELRQIRLTPAGAYFYKKTSQLLQALQQSTLQAQELSQGKQAYFTLAHSSSIGLSENFLQKTQQFALMQQVSMEIGQYSSEQQIELLINRQLDIGILRLPVLTHDYAELELVEYQKERLYAVLPSQHALANSTVLQVSDLKNEKFVSVPHPERGGMSYVLRSLCVTSGFNPQPAAVRSRKRMQLILVQQGFGVSIIAESMIDRTLMAVNYIPLSDQAAYAQVVIAYHRQASPLLKNYVQGLCDVSSA